MTTGTERTRERWDKELQRELEEEVNHCLGESAEARHRWEEKMAKDHEARVFEEACEGEPRNEMEWVLVTLHDQERQARNQGEQTKRLIRVAQLLAKHDISARDVRALSDWWEANKEAIAKMPDK